MSAPSSPSSPGPLAEYCSVASRRVGDSPAGSASTFDTALLLHRPGAWGAAAADDALADLYPEADRAAWAAAPGVRPFAVRPVDDRHTATARHAIVRIGGDGGITGYAAPPAPGELDRATTGDPGPLFAVCTNGRRDRCCAIFGREVVAALAAEHPDATVEISHLGGHRFAGTMLVLPWGYAYGGLDAAAAREVAAAARSGLVHPEHLRGRADLTPVAQVADATWRAQIGPATPGAVRDFTVTGGETAGAGQIVTATVDGEVRSLRVRRTSGATVSSTVCGGKPFTAVSWQVDEVEPALV
jgi:hypothetical protein